MVSLLDAGKPEDISIVVRLAGSLQDCFLFSYELDHLLFFSILVQKFHFSKYV